MTGGCSSSGGTGAPCCDSCGDNQASVRSPAEVALAWGVRQARSRSGADPFWDLAHASHPAVEAAREQTHDERVGSAVRDLWIEFGRNSAPALFLTDSDPFTKPAPWVPAPFVEGSWRSGRRATTFRKRVVGLG